MQDSAGVTGSGVTRLAEGIAANAAMGAVAGKLGNAAKELDGLEEEAAPLTHQHHTISTEIQEKLPPNLQTEPDIVGRRGLPNRKEVEAGKHLGEVHDKTGISPKETGIYGGKYNLRFQEEIMKRGGYGNVTKDQILEIRDLLVKEFGL
jgi:hypothetical protein